MPLYRVGKYRFNSAFLIMTEDRDVDPAVAMEVTMFPGRILPLGPDDASEFGRKLDQAEGDEDTPFIGGAVLASLDPETGRPLRGPGVKDVPGA